MRATWKGRAGAATLIAGVLVCAGSLTTALPATADTPAQAATPSLAGLGTTSVSVFLKAPHPAALARLAQQPVTNRAARLRQLARLVPSAVTHDRVASALRKQGLDVTGQSSWSITATGSTGLLASLFGSLPSLTSHYSAEQFRAATGPLPVLPSVLHGLVSGVYRTTGGPAVFHARTTTLTGADVRRADTPAHVPASTGTRDAKLTIATLQLAPFSSSDLTNYAKRAGLADPVAAHRYRAITVDGGPGVGDRLQGGGVEVALDQESILSTAPSAVQHAYFAPNTDAGYADVFAHVYDDAAGTKHATAPDPHLAAMSVSWGECEALTGLKNIKNLEPIFQSVVASGVTIFASAGDDGIYDCGSSDGTGTDNSTADVDYPGSSPEVVSVGGTNLHAATSVANTGSNWTEKAWSCTDPESCQNTTTGTGGGGGGVSGNAYRRSTGGTTGTFPGFARPIWQTRALAGDRPYASVKHRMVPDIAADADPATGFVIYSSDPTFTVEALGNTGTVGGTSLASPLSAAQLVNTLGDLGRTSGVGNIHGALYSAYRDTHALKASNRRKAFRDVVSGTIGTSANRGDDPSVSAARGFDTVSGLGGVLWSALRPYLTSTQKPKAQGHIAHVGAGKVRVQWKAGRGRDKLLLGTARVVLREAGRSKPIGVTTKTSGRFVVPVKPGRTVTLTVIARDVGGRQTKRVVSVGAKKKHRR